MAITGTGTILYQGYGGSVSRLPTYGYGIGVSVGALSGVLVRAIDSTTQIQFLDSSQRPRFIDSIVDSQLMDASLVSRFLEAIVETVPVWQVNGAGNDAFNGSYDENGTYAGLPAYQHTGGVFWLFWNTVWMDWALSLILGGAGWYRSWGGPDLPANPWTAVGVGTAPGPTLRSVGVTGQAQFLNGSQRVRFVDSAIDSQFLE